MLTLKKLTEQNIFHVYYIELYLTNFSIDDILLMFTFRDNFTPEDKILKISFTDRN